MTAGERIRADQSWPDWAAWVVRNRYPAVALIHDDSRTAFEIRIAPVLHTPRFSTDSAVFVQSAPCDRRAETRMHWRLQLIPRTENLGGFELGWGGVLVSRLPQVAAAILPTNSAGVHA